LALLTRDTLTFAVLVSRYYTFTIAVLVSTIAVLVSTIAVLVLAERGAYLAATEAADGIGARVSHPR
jgi:hypothetical protein